MSAYAVYNRAPGQGDDRLLHGQKNVAVAGTAEPLVSESTPCTEVLIQAKRNNTGRIYWGGPNVPSDDTGGVYLLAGDGVSLQVQNLNQVHLNATVGGEGVTYAYFRTVP